jgi:predicted permease
MGRSFTEAETAPDADRAAILTDACWRQRFGGDPAVIGRSLRVDGLERTVVGVLPPGFTFLSSKTRIYFPLSSYSGDRAPGRRHSGSSTHMIARLAPGASVEEAQSQIDAHNAAMEADDPEARMIADAGFRSVVRPLHAEHVAAIRPMLLLLQTGALLLLFIGAVNVANLLLIRAGSRAKELAVRQAIGASPRHLVSLVLVESTLLTCSGGILGIAVGAAGMRLLTVLGASRLPLGSRIVFDAPVAWVALAAAIVLGIAIGAPIAWHHLRVHSNTALQSEFRGSTSSRAAQRMRHGFLVAQIALAFVLLAGAGLLGLSLKQVTAVSPGFRPEHVLSGQVSLPWTTYRDGSARLAFIDRLLDRLARQPAVAASGIATNVPFSGNSNKSAATVKGYSPRPGESPRAVYAYGVGGEYFPAMGLTLLEGRFLTAADARSSGRVCVVDDDFARRYFPGGGALGQRVFAGSAPRNDADAFSIVGVVGAVKQAGLSSDEALGAVYYPYGDRFDSAIYIVIRSSLPPESLGGTLQQAVRAVDPELPVNNLRAMDTRIADSLVTTRSPALLALLFSGIAILLTAIGTYGVLSYAVAQRRREIGLRMALGARPAQVRAQFVTLALRLLSGGVLLGLIGAWATGRAMQTVLFHVPPVHVATLAGTAAILGVVALAACLLPSHRAARISPMEALTDA